jgi:site-specific DNA recombinase
MDDTIRPAAYGRVSSDKQADELTIDSQVAALRQRIVEDGLKLDDELCFLDEGYSGHTLIRPALEKLRDVAHCGGIDRLYVHSPDRLARKYAYQVVLLEELRKCGVEVVFLNDLQQERSPEGELLVQVQGMIAEYERAKILDLFLTVYSSIFLQNRGLRDHRGGVAPGAVSPPGADGSTC